MEKTLNFTADGENYTLTFTRETMIATENMGFNINNVSDKPVSSLTCLWRGAFLAKHDTLTLAKVDELLERVDNEKLLDALIELYQAPLTSLFDEEHSKNAIKWTVN